MFFAALALSLAAQAAETQPAYVYDNAQANRIAACVRSEMVKAPITTMDAYRPGQNWSCMRLLYLWDSNRELSILVDRDRSKSHIYHFERFNAGGYPVLAETKELSGDRVLYTLFGHRYQHGLASEHLTTGAPPNMENYAVVTSSGHLIVEQSTSLFPAHVTEWPSLKDHPRAIYRDTPVTPSSFLNQATYYAVCSTEDARSASYPCFE